jgi:hypothetical protein
MEGGALRRHGAWGHRERPSGFGPTEGNEGSQEILLSLKIRPSFSSLPSVKNPSGMSEARTFRSHAPPTKQGTRELPREFPNSTNHQSPITWSQGHGGVGRGCGVGRGLGVGCGGVAVGVALGVTVGVTVGVAVGVTLGVTDGVGLGVGVAPQVPPVCRS